MMKHTLMIIFDEFLKIDKINPNQWIFIHDDDAFVQYMPNLNLIAQKSEGAHFQCMFSGVKEVLPKRRGKYTVSASEHGY